MNDEVNTVILKQNPQHEFRAYESERLLRKTRISKKLTI